MTTIDHDCKSAAPCPQHPHGTNAPPSTTALVAEIVRLRDQWRRAQALIDAVGDEGVSARATLLQVGMLAEEALA
jgi:hypothetical protein